MAICRELSIILFAWIVQVVLTTWVPSFGAEQNCVFIKAGTIFDTREGRRLSRHDILVFGNSMSLVSREVAPLDEGCRVINLGAYTVLPGLIDTHTHILMTDRSYSRDFSKELLKISHENMTDRILEAKRHARSLLMSGITTIRDLGNSGSYVDVKLRDEMVLGSGVGPRMYVSGPGISVKEAQFPVGTPPETIAREYDVIRSKEDIARVMREHRDKRVDVIKIYADNDPNPGVMQKELLQEAIAEAHRLGFKVAVHATTDISARNAAYAGADSIEHGYELSEQTLKLMAENKIFLIPTDLSKRVSVIFGKHGSGIQKPSDRILRALRQGVPIAFGSDMYVDLSAHSLDWGNAAKETLFSYVEQGMSNKEALLSATFEAAALLGRPDLGVIEVGAKADIIAIKGDPLHHIRDLANVVFVMKDGKVYCEPGRKCL